MDQRVDISFLQTIRVNLAVKLIVLEVIGSKGLGAVNISPMFLSFFLCQIGLSLLSILVISLCLFPFAWSIFSSSTRRLSLRSCNEIPAPKPGASHPSWSIGCRGSSI